MSKSSNLVKGDDRVEEMKEDEKDGQLVDQLMVSKYKVIYKVLFCLSVYADQKQILYQALNLLKKVVICTPGLHQYWRVIK